MDGNMNNGFQDPNAGFQNQGAGFQDPNAGFANPNAGFQNTVDTQNQAGFASTGYYDPNAAYQQPGFQTAGFQATNDWGASAPQQSKKGIPALICGICGVAFFWLGFTAAFFIPVALGIVGIVMGSMAIKANGKDVKGKVGLILGIVAIALPILIFTIACSVGVAQALK